jgi:predicted  nucleic acid-binding Zn-ribbon protein
MAENKIIVNAPISVGELMDKISILKIKKKNITDEKKLLFINEELQLLSSTLNAVVQDAVVQDNKINEFLDKLIEVNSKLWKIEDDIRLCERNKKFNQHFIDLAREVYITNDKRTDIKLAINNHFGSTLVEVKSYMKY